jgi:hypothetical protein
VSLEARSGPATRRQKRAVLVFIARITVAYGGSTSLLLKELQPPAAIATRPSMSRTVELKMGEKFGVTNGEHRKSYAARSIYTRTLPSNVRR